MKIFVFILALLFSVSVLADCCNSEIEVSSDTHHAIADSGHDDCHTQSKTTSHHCHCSPTNHLKLISDFQVALVIPSPVSDIPLPSHTSNLSSSYEAMIFHPPIA